MGLNFAGCMCKAKEGGTPPFEMPGTVHRNWSLAGFLNSASFRLGEVLLQGSSTLPKISSDVWECELSFQGLS